MCAIPDLKPGAVEKPAEESLRTPVRAPRPLQVTWEMTRECEWKAAPARRAARLRRDRPQVSTAEAFHLLEEIVEMRVPMLALTGGDALLRPDLLPIIEYAARREVRTALTLLPTPRLNAAVISELKQAGLMRVGFWLNGSTAALHDAYWGVAGLYRRTLELIGICSEVRLPVQVNTILARRNFNDVEPMLELLTRLDVPWWNVFFFVPGNPEQMSEMLSAEEQERIFAKLYAASRQVAFQTKTTEGQPYQRYVMQQRARESRTHFADSETTQRGFNESEEFVFIDYKGEVYPSRFLPLSAGSVLNQSLGEIYRNSSLFVSLRDSSKLKGKCGRCPVRKICGGSRARAYAVTGDLFAPDPGCAYVP